MDLLKQCAPQGFQDGTIPKGMSCLDAFTGAAGGCGVRFPEKGEVLGPWIAIEFMQIGNQGTDKFVTVSNRSSNATNPQDVAVIKSFEFGHSDGTAARIVIHDQQGGSFDQFMANLVKDWACLEGSTVATVLCKIKFGWVKSGCDAPLLPSSSPCYYLMCDAVETNYSEGKFIFEITARDTCFRMFEGASEVCYGGEGEQGMFLKEAIKKLMTEDNAPVVGRVSFKKKEGNQVVDCRFQGATEEERINGPKGKWQGDSMDKMTVVRRWLEEWPTESGKGWVPQYNPEEPQGELIFWEDAKPKDGTDVDWDSSCIGTYIVNGGKSSPVIEFNPKIRWDWSNFTANGGGLGNERIDAHQTEGSKNPGRDVSGLTREENRGAGQRVQTTPSDTARDIHGSSATKEVRKAEAEARKALKVYLYDSISADLVIVGDPTICRPSEAILNKNISIVVINPFHIMPSPEGGEWMAQPVCNEVLSNKAWVCTGVTHRIDAGSYTTTIGVMLATPGLDTPPDSPLGGWSGGWVPPTC